MTCGKARKQVAQYLQHVSPSSGPVHCTSVVPGCSVESIVFFASHKSGVMSRILPVLYAVTSCLAFSRPAADVKSVLQSA